MQIFHALGPIKRGLCSGVTNALEHGLEGIEVCALNNSASKLA